MASLVVLGGRFCCYSNALHILGDSLQFHFFQKKKKKKTNNNKEPLILHVAKGYKS
jgi:polyferredoxin